jgi:hypothetical protein
LKEPPEHPVGFGIRVDVGDPSGIMQVGWRGSVNVGFALGSDSDGNRQSRGDIVIRLNTMRVAVMLGVLVLVLQASPVRAESSGANAGLGSAAVISSLIYGPVKMVYSLLGAVIGGFAWGLSGGDTEVLTAVISPAVRGDYVITPSHLRGEQPIEFIGRRPDYREETVVLEEVY